MSMYGPRLKLARAREHLTVFDEEAIAFIQSKPANVETGKTQEGTYLARLHFTEPPARLGILAADVFQTLRASLDYLTWELALRNLSNGEPCYKTEFPICGNCNRDKKKFRTATTSLSTDACNEIQALQPYHHEKSYKCHPLWVLNFFCNIAKHRSIPTTGNVLNVTFPLGTKVKVIDDVTVDLIYQAPQKDFKPDGYFTVAFLGIRKTQAITLLPHQVINLYNFVTNFVFPRFIRFFP